MKFCSVCSACWPACVCCQHVTSLGDASSCDAEEYLSSSSPVKEEYINRFCHPLKDFWLCTGSSLGPRTFAVNGRGHGCQAEKSRGLAVLESSCRHANGDVPKDRAVLQHWLRKSSFTTLTTMQPSGLLLILMIPEKSVAIYS